MTNIFQQAREIIFTKRCGQFTKRDTKVVNQALFAVTHILPRVEPEYDYLTIDLGLAELAALAEGN